MMTAKPPRSISGETYLKEVPSLDVEEVVLLLEVVMLNRGEVLLRTGR
jgi:hypothetical protein